MTPLNIAHQRLHTQRLVGAKFETPGDVVQWFGAVQAQDYPASLWAIGLRMRDATESGVEQAVAEGTIVRTWPMRRTLHFVAASDVRWMLELLTPRALAGSVRLHHQQLGLDKAVFARCAKIFAKALAGGHRRTRPAMYELLERSRISTAGGRGMHILAQLAQEGLICFGPREGKQPTLALLEEWAPGAKRLERDEALAELARRYFTSHGPATVQDFGWWSGLAAADARIALEMGRSTLLQEKIGGKSYWFSSVVPVAKQTASTMTLLPAYDEYMVAYKDRSAALDPLHAKREDAGHGIFRSTIVLGGQVVGTWGRALKKGSVIVAPSPFEALKKTETLALDAAARQYGAFLGLPVALA